MATVTTVQSPAATSSRSAPTTPSPQSDGIYSRLRRSISHRGYFSQNLPSSSPTPPSTENAQDGTTIEQKGKGKSKKRTAFERFIDFGRKRKDEDPPFPPPQWEVERLYANLDKSLPELPEQPPDSSEESDDTDTAPPPTPATLANRIQTMIHSLPALFSSTPASTSAEVGGAPEMISDPAMISLLSSPSVMNGSSKTGSVWSILDQLKARLPGTTPPTADSQPSTSATPPDIPTNEEPAQNDDDSSVMLYGPLVPEDGSEVELAVSELICEGQVPSEESKPGTFARIWPFSGKDKNAEEGPHAHHPHDKKIWLPSATKISLQVNWWGYRIYLPPPVLDALDSKRVEGAKRAAILTTALKWLLDHIPMMIIPPQFRPAAKMLKRLVPYLGYIGVFVAWSWGAIKMFDKGNGVVLSATWLLPLALIPGTWDDDEFPELRTQPKPTSDEGPQQPSPPPGHTNPSPGSSPRPTQEGRTS